MDEVHSKRNHAAADSFQTKMARAGYLYNINVYAMLSVGILAVIEAAIVNGSI